MLNDLPEGFRHIRFVILGKAARSHVAAAQQRHAADRE